MEQKTARKEYERRINRAIDFIAAHLTENLTLDDIANAASFSKFHFHRLFQAHVGETVLEFSRRLKLEQTASQLHFDQSKDITSIALDFGFSSSQNFAKAFKKHFGISPSEYRIRDRNISNPTQSKNGNADSNCGTTVSKDRNAQIKNHGHIDDKFNNELVLKKEITVTINVDVKEISEQHVAYVRTVGEYAFDRVKLAWQELGKWAGPRGLMQTGDWIGIAWDNPAVTSPDKCRYDACVTLPEGTGVSSGISQQMVPGGKFAIYRSHVVNNDFQKGWDRLLGEWLPGSGYQPSNGPAYELVVESGVGDPEGRWVVDIHLPVKPL